ncbi:hypothetical protein CE91St44_04090 [Oscillospiraceae bacterium]|nr:hypothetical protein CE91St44_04090 [Oscillospiraceae bacterium]
MLLLLFLLAGLAAGLCRGGSLRRAAAFPLRGLWLPLAAYLLKALGGAIGVPPLPLCLAQYGLLLLFCWFNRRQPRWCAPFALGTALNFAVIAANGGRMPVAVRLAAGWPALADRLAAGGVSGYTLAGASTRLAFLGDWVAVAPFGRLLGFASPGDFLLGFGVAALAYCMVRFCPPAPPHTP